jgi:hypothetical protein
VEARAGWLVDVAATRDDHVGSPRATGLFALVCVLEASRLYGIKQLLVSFGQ